MNAKLRSIRQPLLATLTFVATCLLPSCTFSEESKSQNRMANDVGVYPPPAGPIVRVRLGVPPFEVKGQSGGAELNELAADQLTTLMTKTRRFVVIERAQLDQLVKEQNLQGILKPGELAKPGQIRGVDYLALGKVTNLRVKAEKTSSGGGVLDFFGGIGGFDFKNSKARVTTECGVDLRLVNPATGEIAVSEFTEFTKTDSIGALGIKVLGVNAGSEAELELSDDNKGLILRLALDDTLKKMLPDLDTFLESLAAEKAAAEKKTAEPAK